MSFHEVNWPPRRKNQEPRPDGALVQRRDQTGSGSPPQSEGATGFDLSGIGTHGPEPLTAPSARVPTVDTGWSTATDVPVPHTTETAPGAAATAAPATLIVDDTVTEPRPGQLRKTEFLDQLRAAVRAEVELALAGTGRSTEDCPYLDHWFDYYRRQSSDRIENAIRRYAPQTRGVRTAAEYVPLVAARVRGAVAGWASTGDLSGLPEDLPPGLTGGLFGGIGGFLGGLLFAEREGGARADDPVAVQARLGAGRPLDSGVRSRMESVFGQSFAGVRTHTDTTASKLSAEQNAKAFTVGEHVAFGAGEYRPGTVVGDALIAHELAHVTQQAGDGTSNRAAADHAVLEQDADRSAAGAVAALLTGSTASLPPRTRNGSGLRLQRCGGAQVRTRVTASGGRLTAPSLTAAPAGTKGRKGQDARALSIIAIATDTRRPVGERTVDVVLQIISQYFPDGLEKINSLTYDETQQGFETTTVHVGRTVRGDIKVGKDFIGNESEKDFAANFARRFPRLVLAVGHEIMHVDQWRDGMTGEGEVSDEREFLAYHWVATAPERPGTGAMQHGTRVLAIDDALGYYNCLSPKKQQQYRAQRDELLALRPVEVRASNRSYGDPPTACVRAEKRKRGDKQP